MIQGTKNKAWRLLAVHRSRNPSEYPSCRRIRKHRDGRQFGLRGRAPRGVTGELSPASVYVSLLPDINLYFIMCGYLCYAD